MMRVGMSVSSRGELLAGERPGSDKNMRIEAVLGMRGPRKLGHREEESKKLLES
jgi:hypothetical protein